MAFVEDADLELEVLLAFKDWYLDDDDSWVRNAHEGAPLSLVRRAVLVAAVVLCVPTYLVARDSVVAGLVWLLVIVPAVLLAVALLIDRVAPSQRRSRQD